MCSNMKTAPRVPHRNKGKGHAQEAQKRSSFEVAKTPACSESAVEAQTAGVRSGVRSLPLLPLAAAGWPIELTNITLACFCSIIIIIIRRAHPHAGFMLLAQTLKLPGIYIPVFALSRIPARFLFLASRQQTCYSRRSRFSWRPPAAAACGGGLRPPGAGGLALFFEAAKRPRIVSRR